MARSDENDGQNGALACRGIRLLEIGEGFGVSALCGQLFAGLGAWVKVIDLGRPEALQSPGSAYRARLLHAGAEVLGPDSVGQLAALIEWADVVVADRPSLLDRPELSGLLADPALPGKIVCITSLYGGGSARADWKGGELIAEAASALMACNGYPERPPVTSTLPYALHTTALFGFAAILTALRERERSGEGQSIDLAIVDCITAILGNFLPSYFLSGREPKRIGNRHTIAAPWNIYPALDGSVVICTGTGGTGWWAKVMAVLDRPDLVDDPRFATESDRVRNVEEVDAILSAWTSQRTMRDVVDLMTRQAIPVSEIGTIESVLADPHFRDLRAMILQVDAADRPLMGTPLKVGAWHGQAGPMKEAGEAAPDGSPWRDGSAGKGEGPLAGLRILEFASRTSVPLAGRLFADFGADVVKIEPLKGDALRGAGQQIGGSSYLFHINNAGKRSVAVDPTTPEGRHIILDLARHADVFMENLAPGSVAKMGLGPEAMKRANPDIVYCSVSGFGARSGYGSKRALDTVVQAACGLMHMTGYPDHFAVKLGISAVDLTTATATLASVLAGLRERQLTGRGVEIDLAMADVGVWMTQHAWPRLLCDGVSPIRLGNGSAEACPHGIFPTADDRHVAIAVESDQQWAALRALSERAELADPALATIEGRLADRDLIETSLAEWTRSASADDIASLCQSWGVPASPVRGLPELVGDPEIRARDMIFPLRHPSAGDILLLGNPARLSRTPPTIRRGAPMLGEHSGDVLSGWLGLTGEQLAALRGEAVIGWPSDPEPAPAETVLAAVQSGA